MKIAEQRTTEWQEIQQKIGLSSFTLKMIAILTMTIDHMGFILFPQALWMRGIGRLAFPIFCFTLTEGFSHTHDLKRYIQRMLVVGLLSEIPFNLAESGQIFSIEHQNVFFTLLIGLLTMCIFRYIEKQDWKKGVRIISYIAALAVGMVVAEFLNTDYGAIGVLSIMILYMFRESKPRQIVAGCITFLWEITAPLAFVPIGFYNGKRGLKMKYFFYIFYPAHLLVIYLVVVALGMNGYSAV